MVERIYYVNNRACNDKLTQHDISLSNLVRVLKYVDEENDINKVLDYFSYLHFFICCMCVCLCFLCVYLYLCVYLF